MQELRLVHEIECDEDTFWFKCFFDEAFNKRLYETALQFPSFELTKYEDDGQRITRAARGEPKLPPLPGPVKKVVGEGMAYVEEGTFDRGTKTYRFKATPVSLGDKAKTEGEITVEKRGDKRIARIAKMKVDVKVFMVGGMIEDQIVSSLRNSYEKAAAFTNEWIKEKGL